MSLSSFIAAMKAAPLEPIIVRPSESLFRTYVEYYVFYKGKAFPNKMRCAHHLDAKARLESLIQIGEYPLGSYLQ